MRSLAIHHRGGSAPNYPSKRPGGRRCRLILEHPQKSTGNACDYATAHSASQRWPSRTRAEPVAGIIGGHRKARRQPATHAKPTDVQHDHRQHTEPPKPFPTAGPASEKTGRDYRLRPCVPARQQPIPGHPLWQPRHHPGGIRWWIIASPQDNRSRGRRPDLLVACNVSPEDYRASNGHIISDP